MSGTPLRPNPEDDNAKAWQEVGTAPAAASPSPQPLRNGTPGGVPVMGTRKPVLAYEPFPIGALPRSMGEHARQTAEGMDADPVLIVGPMLAIFAAAIGNAVRVQVKRGWQELSCLWIGVVSLPGSLKTQTQGVAAAPVHAAQRLADASHADDLAEYRTAKSAHDAEQRSRKRSAAVEPSKSEPEEPKRWQCLTQDATPESLVGVLMNNPRGVVNLWDELGGFFGGFARYNKGGSNAGESGAAFFKSAYSGTPQTENRKGADGKGRYVRVEAPLVSVAGSIQPDALKRILLRQYIDDGLASRFLWTWPPDRPGGWAEDTDTDETAATLYAETYRRLLGLPLDTDPWTRELKPANVKLSVEATTCAKAWVEFVKVQVRDAQDSAIRAAWAKLKGGAFRIALVLHLTEWAERGGVGELGTISADTLSRAVRIAEWFGREAKRVYAMLGESEDETQHRRLVEWIAGRGGAVSVRDLTHGKSAYHNNTEAAERDLSQLVEDGIGRWEWTKSGPKGGPPRKLFRLVSPVITTTTTPPSDPAQRGDGEVDGQPDSGNNWGEVSP